jgi:hypothetical protein
MQTQQRINKLSNIKILALMFATMAFQACGQMQSLPAINETGDEVATPIDNTENSGLGSVQDKQTLQLGSDMNVRYLKNNVLELVVEIPTGTKIEVQDNYQVVNFDYRNSDGGLSRNSTGFANPIKIIEVPKAYQSKFTATKIAQYNNVAGGLHILASTIGAADTSTGSYSAISAGTAGSGFLKFYNSSGKIKSGFTKGSTKRFPNINKGVALESLSSAQQAKSIAIYNELKKAVDRTVDTSKSYMILNKTDAQAASINFEKYGTILKYGAWTIATQATAVRHGFANVPCAETQSEILRQAYTRAGYKVTNDFNTSRGNPLIWSNTAAVKNFSMALYLAGWIAWDATKYKPMTGAFLMHGVGQSPGHTYISAGDNGRIIVDNGAPQGRDLRKTTGSSIELQYQTGLFFLPPGINPEVW